MCNNYEQLEILGISAILINICENNKHIYTKFSGKYCIKKECRELFKAIETN